MPDDTKVCPYCSKINKAEYKICHYCGKAFSVFREPQLQSNYIQSKNVQTSDETKVCPYCAENIKAKAIVCRYCGRDLPMVIQEKLSPIAEKPKIEAIKTQNPPIIEKQIIKHQRVINYEPIGEGLNLNKLFFNFLLLLVISGFVLIIALIFSEKLSNTKTKTYAYSTSPASNGPTQYEKSLAWVAATTEVKKRLKAPSTAKFPFGSVDETITKSGNIFTVKSWVDSENSYGAKIRANFIAIIEITDNDHYNVISVDIYE